MAARGRGLGTLCLALSLLLAGGPRAVLAQGPPGGGGGGLALRTVQPLAYGTLLPGDPDAVAVTDAVRRGELELKGKGQIDIMVVLPTSMVATGGAEIPLEFRYGDGGVQPKGSNGVSLFDPNMTYSVNLTNNQSPARIFLGGLAKPAPDQVAGDYTAQITVIVAQP